MRRFVYRIAQLFRHAVPSAACCLLASAALAEQITVRSLHGSLEVTGRFIGYDGEYLQIEGRYGPVSVILENVTCSGAACPDPDAFVPTVRISGAANMARVLVPALVEGFARAKGYGTTHIDTDPSHFRLDIAQDSRVLARFAFRSTTSDEGFADLFAHEADIVMSVREPKAEEVRIGQSIGIGQISDPAQSRVVGLDALVPIVSPKQALDQITLPQLARVFAGEIVSWRVFGGEDVAISLHKLFRSDGRAQRADNDIVIANGLLPSRNVVRHSSLEELTDAVADDPTAIGITSYDQLGRAKALEISDSCGFVSLPSIVGLKAHDYPLTAPVFLYLPSRRQHPIVREFLAWLRTPAAQLVVRRGGFVDPGAIPVPINAQGQRLSNAISAAGDEVPLFELQRMIRIMAPRTRLSTSFRFDVGSTRLDAQSRSALFDLAQAIRDGQYTGDEIMLIGFSDGRGPATANRDLGSARAEAIKRMLVELLGEVPVDIRLETESFGEALPLGCDETEWGRQSNRRVELWIGP